MSFTAEVKDELSRIEADRTTEAFQLSAMVRVCGTLTLLGGDRFSLSLTTETGAVARTIIKLFARVYKLRVQLTVRRSVLHKTRNYLLVVPADPALTAALVHMGVLTSSHTLTHGVNPLLVNHPDWSRAFLRGAFMAGGFISSPRSEAHFELVAQNDELAEGIARLLGPFGITVHVVPRRNAHVIYLKNAQDIVDFLKVVGASQSVLEIEGARVVKSLRNETNRLVNAEMANQRKTAEAANEQVNLVGRVEAEIGFDNLPPALRAFCELRLDYPELSLRELGEMAVPKLSKSAVYHRVRRLEKLLEEARQNRVRAG